MLLELPSARDCLDLILVRRSSFARKYTARIQKSLIHCFKTKGHAIFCFNRIFLFSPGSHSVNYQMLHPHRGVRDGHYYRLKQKRTHLKIKISALCSKKKRSGCKNIFHFI